MPTGSSTSSTATMASTNPTLTGLFTSLFGGKGGAGETGTTSLSNIAKGQNIDELNTSLTKSNKATFASTIGQIKEAFGSRGMGSSSVLGKVLGQAATQNANDLTQNLATSDLQAQNQQLNASAYLTQIFSDSANRYFQNSSTGKQSDSGMTTFLKTFQTMFPGGL